MHNCSMGQVLCMGIVIHLYIFYVSVSKWPRNVLYETQIYLVLFIVGMYNLSRGCLEL